MRERHSGRRAVPRLILWCAPLAVATWAAWSMLPTPSASRPMLPTEAPRLDVVAAGEFHPTADWLDFLFGGMRQPRETRPARRPAPRPRPRNPAEAHQKPAEAYRTLCVRLCDGYYFPISFSTRRDRFAGDAGRCERQCPARSRLFVYRNPGEQVEDMRDLKGNPYLSLPTALVYRTKYVADCTCRDNSPNEATPKRHDVNADESPRQSAVGTAGKTR